MKSSVRDSFLFIFMCVLGGVAISLFHSTLNSTFLDQDRMILIIVSVVLNIGVILYHYTIPPHPKFVILPFRKWTIRFHVWSGTVELLSGLSCIIFQSKEAAIVQACAALLFHVPTALLQTPIVFGSKAIMIPSYLLCIIIHAYCAFQLFLDPSSLSWAINTFLIFNVYAWCRFYFYLFDRYHLIGNQKYTVSILMAGLTIIPALFGSLSLLLLVGYVAVYIILVRSIFIKNPQQYAFFVHERGRDSLLSGDFIQSKVHLSDILTLKTESERDKADYVFRLLDTNQDGYLAHDELQELLTEWGLSKKEVLRYFSWLHDNRVDFDLFFHKMSPIWKYIYFEILKSRLVTEESEMVGRSLESLRSTKSVQEIKKNIEFNLLKQTPFLRDAENQLVEDLASSLTVKNYFKGDVIFNEGDSGDRFYLIYQGSVSVHKHNDFITSLNEGACFGEIALIENRPRNATIKSESDLVLYSLSKASFDYVLEKYPQIRDEIFSLILKRR